MPERLALPPYGVHRENKDSDQNQYCFMQTIKEQDYKVSITKLGY